MEACLIGGMRKVPKKESSCSCISPVFLGYSMRHQQKFANGQSRTGCVRIMSTDRRWKGLCAPCCMSVSGVMLGVVLKKYDILEEKRRENRTKHKLRVSSLQSAAWHQARIWFYKVAEINYRISSWCVLCHCPCPWCCTLSCVWECWDSSELE